MTCHRPLSSFRQHWQPLFAALVLFPLLRVCFADLTVSKTIGSDELTQSFRVVRDWFDGAKRLSGTLAGPLRLITDTNVTNSIAFIIRMEHSKFSGIEKLILKAQNGQALAAVIALRSSDLYRNDPGRLMYASRRGETAHLTLPTFTMAYDYTDRLVGFIGGNATITEEGTENPWLALGEAPLQVCFSLIAALFLALTITTICKLIRAVRAPQRSLISLVALSLLLAANVLGLLCWGLDPLGSRRVIPVELVQVLSYVYIPLILCATFMVLLYWLECLTMREVRTVRYLKRLRIPFYGFAIYLFIAEIATAAVRIVFPGVGLPFTFALLNVLLSILVVDIVVVIVIYLVHKSAQSGLDIGKRLRRMNAHMIALAVVFLATLMLLGLLASRNFTSPLSSSILILAAAFMLSVVSLIQVSLLHAPVHTLSSKSKHMFDSNLSLDSYKTTTKTLEESSIRSYEETELSRATNEETRNAVARLPLASPSEPVVVRDM